MHRNAKTGSFIASQTRMSASSELPSRVVVVLGTRPEAIKLAPVIRALRHNPSNITVNVVVTGQHRQMLNQVLRRFHITPDVDLALMRPNQSLGELTSRVLRAVD